MRQLLDLAHTQAPPTNGNHKLLDLAGFDPVHAHELAHQIHVGINGERAREELVAHFGAHLGQQSQAHTHPAFAAGKLGGNLGHVHPARVAQLRHKRGLLQDAQRVVVGDPQQAHDRPGLILSERTIGHGGQAQLARATMPLKAVEQHLSLLDLHSLQRFLDAALGYRGQKPLFEGRLFEPKTLVTEVQITQFHFLRHA